MQFFVGELVKIFIEGQKKIRELRMRVCNICEVEKEITEYNLTKEGKYKYKCCKSCYSEKRNSKRRELYSLNKEEISKNRKELYYSNREFYINCSKKYYNENKEEVNGKRNKGNRVLYTDEERLLKSREKSLKYYYENKKEVNRKKVLRDKEKMKINPLFKLSHNIRTLIRKSLQNQFTEKSKRTQEILGCTYEEFKIYLESQFDENMNWENQGSYWHMDHIKPISLATSKDEVYELNHYTNFQPLYCKDNLSKGNKY